MPSTSNQPSTFSEKKIVMVRVVHLYPHSFPVMLGHHEEELLIKKMDVSGSGDVTLASATTTGKKMS